MPRSCGATAGPAKHHGTHSRCAGGERPQCLTPAGRRRVRQGSKHGADALKDKGFSTHQVQQLLKANNGTYAVQKIILNSTGILLACGFNFDQITSILHGCDRSSVKMITTITTICKDLVEEGKAHIDIVYHVRAGRKSCNRLQIVEAYERRRNEKKQ